MTEREYLTQLMSRADDDRTRARKWWSELSEGARANVTSFAVHLIDTGMRLHEAGDPAGSVVQSVGKLACCAIAQLELDILP